MTLKAERSGGRLTALGRKGRTSSRRLFNCPHGPLRVCGIEWRTAMGEMTITRPVWLARSTVATKPAIMEPSWTVDQPVTGGFSGTVQDGTTPSFGQTVVRTPLEACHRTIAGTLGKKVSKAPQILVLSSIAYVLSVIPCIEVRHRLEY